MLNDLEGYKIYYGISPDQLTFFINVAMNLTSYVIENDPRIQSGTTYYFGMTAYTSEPRESLMSNIVSKDL